MARTVFALSAVCLFAVTAGCTMCAHPYDYCGPTFTGKCGEACMPNARAGSILSPGIEPIMETPLGPELVDTEVQAGPELVVTESDDTAGPLPGLRQPEGIREPGLLGPWVASSPEGPRLR